MCLRPHNRSRFLRIPVRPGQGGGLRELYENPVNLPGRWYLQIIEQIFKQNRLPKGTFVGLGRPLNLKNITCPTYLLAGAADDITTPEQVLEDGSRWQVYPGDLDLTLSWKLDTELTVMPSDDEIS